MNPTLTRLPTLPQPVEDGRAYVFSTLIEMVGGPDGWTLQPTELGREVLELMAERDELRLSLLAERFDQVGALPGWEAENGPAFRLGHHPIRGYVFRARSHPVGESWEWQRFEGGALATFGYAVGPHEAMRAAMEGA